MDKVLEVRAGIYDHFHSSSALDRYFSKPENVDKFAAYYTSMYLVQDSGEAVWSHIRRGFSTDPMQAYIEFWGVMQAISIQQDAISELYQSVIGERLKTSKLKSWNRLRDMRHLCAGHPARRSHGVPSHQRTFMGRMFGSYDEISYETWDAHTRETSHPTFNLRQMISEYDAEAAVILEEVLSMMRTKWP